uniref:Succinate:cytochrome c oxidoreductase subunit 3 n=1 Tax=Storeatula sp. CCMP1868 TaxID=195070 RepID=A0A2P1G868_9CRYP|nr:succinate:cytochrome c oxidoreductase subunit 3 [Storeatula sp. CCMP1868]AVM81139.1 succinate:cytochrome c oxidoreductase subunit 3 [Storeatula sp. CCMP1868]
MKKKVRPLSPHLLVYKPQLTSIFSIFHRISGGLLFLFFLVLSSLFYSIHFCFSFFATYFIYYYLFSFLTTILYFLLYFLVFIFSFHMINGLRHLSWDFGLGLEIKNVYITGIFVFFVSSIAIFILIIF